jgi:hypothetical protein
MDEQTANQIIQELGQLYGKYCDAFNGYEIYGQYFLKCINMAQKACWEEITYQNKYKPWETNMLTELCKTCQYCKQGHCIMGQEKYRHITKASVCKYYTKNLINSKGDTSPNSDQ